MTDQFQLKLKTMLSAQALERILASSMRPYSFALQGTEETPRGQRKVLMINFSSEDDRERFRRGLRRLASTAPAPLEAPAPATRPM
jgi:hypothetical protein